MIDMLAVAMVVVLYADQAMDLIVSVGDSLLNWRSQVKGIEPSSIEEKSAIPEADTISAAAAMEPPVGSETGKLTQALCQSQSRQGSATIIMLANKDLQAIAAPNKKLLTTVFDHLHLLMLLLNLQLYQLRIWLRIKQHQLRRQSQM